MPEPAGTARRRPMQRRSTERVARLLDACAEVLDEVGYSALTTREVARRAEVPIGTLYQFFAGKSTLCQALAERNLEAFIGRLSVRLDRDPVSGWQSTASVVIQEYVAMKREMPGFAALDFGDPPQPGLQVHHGGRLIGADRGDRHDPGPGPGPGPGAGPDAGPDSDPDANRRVARRLRPLAVQLGAPESTELTTVLLVAVEIADSLVRLAFRFDPNGDPWLIAEAQQVLGGYLDSRLGPQAPPFGDVEQSPQP